MNSESSKDVPISESMDKDLKEAETNIVIFKNRDLAFAIAMFFCGFLYWNLISLENLGAGVSIFAAIICTATYIYLGISGISHTKESVPYLILILLSACNFLMFDNMGLKICNFIFLSIAFVYWVAVSTKVRLEGKLSACIIGDGINQLILVPFYNLNINFKGIKEKSGCSNRGKNLLHGLLGVLIFLPILIIVTSLLVNADAAFEALINNILISISADFIDYILQIVMGVPVACYLFGLIYGNVHHRHTNHITLESIDKATIALRFAPIVAVYSALTVLNLLFLVFFLSQATYLFSGFSNSLPETMTYAQYARRGFFELCNIVAINLMVIGGAHLFANRKNGITETDSKDQSAAQPPKMLKAETIVLCIFTILLIATALSKMVLYINYYGLTQLRVYTSWFMLMLLIVFIIISIRQFKIFNGTKIAVICIIVSFLVLCYGNIDGFIAKYNINRYLEGSLKSVDVVALGALSDGAVPHMYRLYEQTEYKTLKEQLITYILREPNEEIFGNQQEKTFRDFNMQAYKADKIRNELIFDLQP